MSEKQTNAEFIAGASSRGGMSSECALTSACYGLLPEALERLAAAVAELEAAEANAVT